MERFINKWEIKGISLAVTRHDSLLYAKGYGWADLNAGIPMDASSIMRMASVSKLVTAVGIMRLCEEGKLSLGTKVFGEEGILNDTAYTNSMRDLRMRDITVDHLLQHKGGFTLGAGDPMFNTKDIMAVKHLSTPPTNEELTKIVLGRRLGFTPGAGRRYSNFGYMLLSLVIEKVSGKSYWDFVREEVLEPAGAYQFRPATNYYADRHNREVRYYPPDNELVEEYNGSGNMVERVYGGSNVNGLLGAGGWVAPASDIARLVAAIDGEPGVKNILSQWGINTLTAYDEKDNICRGWVEVRRDGRWTRTGTLSSTHALVERFPDGDCWVLLTNSGVWTGHNFSRDLERLVERLRNRYGGIMPTRNLW
ncbi:MAG: beta-lactamase family protein [Muribaculaceae bacterium]|nr:beta-lactamase family protein [Muribaculaceae bacterium]